MKRQLFYSILILAIFSSCQSEEKKNEEYGIKELAEGEGAYLTKNNAGIPVISWVEKGEKDKDNLMYFSRWDMENNVFGAKQEISTTLGLQAHDEGMPKIAFKKSGEIVAVFGEKRPTPTNSYAGLIFYTQSFDNGKSWTGPKLLVSDSSGNASQRFYDIATLNDGEIGITWLDARKDYDTKGSSIYFASTKGRSGFQNEKRIGESTCECCRTNLYIDNKGGIHVAYRDIINDSIRDMVHSFSGDSGKSFSPANRISADNWVLDGCPHTGPDMTQNSAGLNFVWFTVGGGEGVYYCCSPDNGKTFSQRELISSNAHHPQITAINDKAVAIVWEERVKKDSLFFNKINLMVKKSTGEQKTLGITADTVKASFPILLSIDNNRTLIAWKQEIDDKDKLFYTFKNN